MTFSEIELPLRAMTKPPGLLTQRRRGSFRLFARKSVAVWLKEVSSRGPARSSALMQLLLHCQRIHTKEDNG